MKEKIFKCVEEFGFKVNPRKIRQLDCRQGKPMICGIRVDGRGKVSLPKKTIRKWRGIIHRASFNPEPELRKKIVGFMASLKPIYGHGIGNLPPQIVEPLIRFGSSLTARQIPKAESVKPLEKPKSSYLELKQTRLTDWL